MDKKKWVALAGLILGAVATALASSPYGSNQAVHTACDIALKVLVALGFTAPVSLMGGASGTPATVLKLTQPEDEEKKQ